MPETVDNLLYKINYKIEDTADPRTLEIYAKYSDTAAKAKRLDVSDQGDKSHPVYFKDGVPVVGYDLNDTQPVKYSYNSETKIATITFSNWH